MKAHLLFVLIAALSCDARGIHIETGVRRHSFEVRAAPDQSTLWFPTRTPDETGSSVPAKRTDDRPETSPTLDEITDHLIFTATLSEFLRARRRQEPPDLIWTSDGCTGIPYWLQTRRGFVFLPACLRHDFAYRNHLAQGRLTMERVHAIADRFQADLLQLCDWQHEMAVRTCRMIVRRMAPIARHHTEKSFRTGRLLVASGSGRI